ncbi:MAG: GNAT family protein [Erysipelotrichales bacterium]
MYYFKDINENNFEEVIALKIKDEQAGFLNSNQYSLAQANVSPQYICKAIYYEDKLIGFLVYNFISEDSIFLKTYMIDENFQGQGHGKNALISIMSYLKSLYDINSIELMHYPNNSLSAHLYESVGYHLTGEERMSDAIEVVRLYKFK